MENKICEVTNRDNGVVGYTIPDLGIARQFQPGETKKISIEELKSLQYIPGGDYMLEHLFVIKDSSALDTLNITTEPEYFYTEADVVNLLLTGTLDQLLDCLEFAPDGVIELVKSKAVELQIPDINKRNAISEKTGFNVNNAINVNQIMNADDATAAAPEEKKQRRAAVPTTAEAPTRRTAASKYEVVSRG